MENSKKKIINALRKLNEGVVDQDELEQNIDDLVVTAKDSLDIDDTQAKDFVSGLVGEVNQGVMNDMIKQYGSKEAAEKVYYATANKQDRNPENFHTEDTGDDYESISRGAEYGMDPEAGEDKYLELKKLKDLLVGDMDNEPDEIEEGNDPEKLKRDVSIVMDKLDMSSIAPYIKKIDNPVEQAEMIGQFAEKIGVPRNKLSAVISRLRLLSKNGEQSQEAPVNQVEAKMTKGKLIETVTGNKVIKTVKVKDIK